MSGANPIRLSLWAVALIAVMSGLSLARGALYVDRYEGDMLHLAEIILRVAGGQWPHRDFMTPIGALAAWPIALFVKAGWGVGMASHLGQLLVALALAPVAVWTACSRFAGVPAYGVVALVLVLALALVHGQVDPTISMSMHYNRWAWAAAFVIVPLAILPPVRQRPDLDALALGLCMAALVLIKVTYVMALAPPLVAVLCLRRAWGTLAMGVGVLTLVLAVFTAVAGVSIWPAYIADILATSRSETRAHPGLEFNQVLTGPIYLGGHLLAILGVVLLRQAGRLAEGLALLLFLPGLVFITYQNYGNDPQWFLVAGLIVLGCLPSGATPGPFGWDLRLATGMTGGALAVAALPGFVNLALSPQRHFLVDPAGYAAIFPRSLQHDDIFIETTRVGLVNYQTAAEREVPALEPVSGLAERPDPTVVNGEVLTQCDIYNGMVGWLSSAAREIEAFGIAPGSRIFATDLLGPLWMYSEAIAPLRGGAPWRYDGASGIDDADYVLVPLCAINATMRTRTVDAVRDAGYALREVHRTELFILFVPRRDQTAQSAM